MHLFVQFNIFSYFPLLRFICHHNCGMRQFVCICQRPSLLFQEKGEYSTLFKTWNQKDKTDSTMGTESTYSYIIHLKRTALKKGRCIAFTTNFPKSLTNVMDFKEHLYYIWYCLSQKKKEAETYWNIQYCNASSFITLLIFYSCMENSFSVPYAILQVLPKLDTRNQSWH